MALLIVNHCILRSVISVEQTVVRDTVRTRLIYGPWRFTSGYITVERSALSVSLSPVHCAL